MSAVQDIPKATSIKGLAVGRIVHDILPDGRSKGDHRPATIVRVWDGPTTATVNLPVFTDGQGGEYNDGLPNVVWRTSVKHDPSGETPGTWHFPEYVP